MSEQKHIPIGGQLEVAQLLSTVRTGKDVPKPVTRPRMTVVDRVYYDHPKYGATPHITGYSLPFESDEQPFSRWLSVGEDWQPIDKGWLTGIGMMKLENRSKDQMLRVGHDIGADNIVTFSALPPGADIRIFPACVDDVYHVQATADKVDAYITLFPR